MLRKTTKPIRVGVLGVGRGKGYALTVSAAGMKLAALCDIRKDALLEAGKEFGVATYTDFEKFLQHDMDAVILANYFHQHAPFAIRALKAGKHVLSETTACKTPAEGVALVRAVERSGRIYMLAENYAYFVYIQEMRRLYQSGEVGEMQYGQGEYIHPFDSRSRNILAPGLNHWRNHMPATYYSTHALAPIMYIAGTRPVSVNALCIPPSANETQNLHVGRNDPASVILCRMDNESVVRLTGIILRGHGNWYRIHGTRGLMENLRTGNRSMVRIVHESWDREKGEVSEKLYLPEFPHHAVEAKRAGHGGGDFFVLHHFAEAICKGEQPYLNVYRALDMSLVGIQAYRSALARGAPFEIPDFRNESPRRKYARDDWSPFPEDRRPGQPYPSIRGKITPSKKAITYARKIWREMGYDDQ